MSNLPYLEISTCTETDIPIYIEAIRPTEVTVEHEFSTLPTQQGNPPAPQSVSTPLQMEIEPQKAATQPAQPSPDLPESFTEEVEDAPPQEEEASEGPPETAPKVSSGQSDSQPGTLTGEGSGQGAGRSGGHSAKLDTPSGGATAPRAPAFFIPGKGIGRMNPTSKHKAHVESSSPQKHQSLSAPRTENLEHAPEAQPAPEARELLAQNVKEIAGKLQQPERPIPVPIRLEHIKNLQELADKIQARAQLMNSGREALTVRLNPPHLGLLKVVLETEGHEMRLTFTADNAEAAQVLKESQPHLTQVVTDHGYTLTRCDVDSHPSPQRNAEAYLADQSRRQSAPALSENADENPNAQLEDNQIDRHRPLDLGYNTLDLVA